ncbi:hypothetical protein K1719_023147 [Acacia pycnantha]|nr:hypothetical protein K1719_023147 [Acacia pycnantha]
MIDIVLGFFLLHCHNQKVYELAVTGEPWLMFDHYISEQPRKPDFDQDEEIRRVLKVDKNTMKLTKGRFAKICVQLDLSNPLKPSLMYNRKKRKIKYEELHRICFNCGPKKQFSFAGTSLWAKSLRWLGKPQKDPSTVRPKKEAHTKPKPNSGLMVKRRWWWRVWLLLVGPHHKLRSWDLSRTMQITHLNIHSL